MTTTPSIRRETRIHNDRVDRFGFVSVVLIFSWFGSEFDPEPFLWYQRDLAGIPIQYPVVAAAVAFVMALTRDNPLALVPALRRTGLWVWSLISLGAVSFALFYGIVTASPEIFADWRNLVVVALVVIATARWTATRADPARLLEDLAIGIGAMSAFAIAIWAGGGGISLLGVRVPVFDGHKLFMAVLAVGTGSLALIGRQQADVRRWLLQGSIAASSMLVLTSFRRSFWIAWLLMIIGVVIWAVAHHVLTMEMTARLTFIGVVALVAAVMWLGGEAIGERLASFLPSSDNTFSATNTDHINDVVQALDVIAENPITGLGIGQYYESPLIAQWKVESFEVHNAIVHVWLKFGVLGVLGFVGFHAQLIASLIRPRLVDFPDVAVFAAVGIFFIAELIAQMAGTWAYGSIQMSVLHGVLIGVFMAAVVRRPLSAPGGVELRQ